MRCPLCQTNQQAKIVKGPLDQQFHSCGECFLVFRSREDLVDVESERARYLTHNNSRDDEGYVNFLLRAFELAKKHLPDKQQRLLDYGSGYAPVFTKLMREKGYICDHYDPIFFEEGIRQSSYSTIFCIETAEHFHYPSEDWERLDQLLDENGILTIMTEMWTDESKFPSWHYMKDETHTSFYHLKTLDWIANQYNWTILETDRNRVTVFRK